MKDMFGISVLPYDAKKHNGMLERWRKDFNGPDQMLMLPNGYERASGLETNVAVSADKRVLCSLTGTMLIGLDALIKNPNASPTEVLQGLFALARALEVSGARAGALESYIAIPNDMPEYQKLIEKVGYVEAVPNCKVYRHQFYSPDEVDKKS